jgi:hypothetical protein
MLDTILQDVNNTLHTHAIYIQNGGIEIITIIFNFNTRRAIYVIVVYKPPTTLIEIFLQLFKKHLCKNSTLLPYNIHRCFNVNMLENTFIIKTITRLYATTSVCFNFSKKHNNLQITI